MAEFKNIATLKEHKAAVYALCEAEQDHLFFSGGSDRFVIKWNLKTLEAEKVVSKSPTTIISLLFLKEFNYLLIGQVEGGVHVIDLNKSKELKYLKIHKGYIFDLLFIESKKELVISSGDGTISIWSVPEFKLLFQKKIGEGKNRKIDFSIERNELAIASGDGFVQLMNAKDWSVKDKIEGFGAAVNSLAYQNNASSILVGDKNAHLHEVDLLTNKTSKSIAAHNWAIYDISIHPLKNRIVTASRDKTVKVWDVDQFNVLKRFEGLKDMGHTHSVNKLLWLKYKDYLLSAGDDRSIKVWSID